MKKHDVLCAKLLKNLEQLEYLVSENGEIPACFDVSINAKSSEKFHELRRMRRSLQQYIDKDSALLYVGFLGHFSAGKSSTINSLLHDAGSSYARITGQHPTDKAVTLITHPNNSGSLVATHKRGELDVGSNYVELDILKSCVVVDTPGSGDPFIVEEMVRDFLPICDRIVYAFSAAIPLDKSDLPVLQKVHKELKFIPICFIVTRADEFKINPRQILTIDNFNEEAANSFIGELILRLAASVDGLKVGTDDVLLIDNFTGFNTDKLQSFVFPKILDNTSLSIRLHSHKIDFFYRGAMEIRDFFIHYLEKKITALQSLLETAKSNHSHFQKAVTMANSRLAKSWGDNQDELLKVRYKDIGHIEDKAKQCDGIGKSALDMDKVKIQVDQLKTQVRYSASYAAKKICRSLKSKLVDIFHRHLSATKDRVARSTDPEHEKITPLQIDKINDSVLEYDLKEEFFTMKSSILGVHTVAANELRSYTMVMAVGSKFIMDTIQSRRIFSNIKAIIGKSIDQLREMLEGFFDSVRMYRSAIVTMNARALAEKVGIVAAIEKIEKENPSQENRDSWLDSLVLKMFPEKQSYFDLADQNFTVIHGNLVKVLHNAEELKIPELPDVETVVDKLLTSSDPTKDNEFFQVIQRVVTSLNTMADEHFRVLTEEREKLLDQ